MSALIPLERVVFKTPIQLPGKTAKEGEPPQYPSTEVTVGCYPNPKGMMSKQPYELYFDRSLGLVLVVHPDSKETEEVPFANVQQWRRRRDKGQP